MAKNQGEIRFGIGFNINQQSLSNVKKALSDLKKMSLKDISAAGGNILPLSKMYMASDTNHLHEMREELGKLEKAFEAAYNPKLGTYELNKFNAALQDAGTNAAQAFSVVANMGAQGQAALLDMTSGMLAVNRVGKQTNETFKKLGDTMLNTLRWSLTSTALNAVTGAIQQAFHYAVDLDKSLTDIMIVTDKSSSEMERFAQQANKAAKALGASTKDYTEASLIYYQQGLGDKDVKARTDTTLKTAAVTGQSASAVSEQLTAVWNGYKVSAAESEKYIDKLAAVAASTAADLEELSTGMSKVAAAANVMGVDVDQLNAQLATIVSVTREAPESIGTALKTVYARMSDIEAGLDTETTLGEYTSQMAAMGVNVLDANGKLRDMGAVVEEIGNKWASLNREQQVSLAQSIAGTRQYSRMMALFDNWDMYQETLATSAESAGALTEQHIKYLNSIEAHQNKLKASAEGLYDSIFDSDSIKGVYNVLAKLIDGASILVKSIGGMPGILASIALITTTIGKNSIQEMLMKRQMNELQQEIYKTQITNGQKTIEQLSAEIQLTGDVKERYNDILKLEERIYANADNLTEEGWNSLQAGVNQYIETLKIAIDAEKEINDLQKEKTQVDKELDGTGLKYNFSGKKGDARRIQAQNRVKNLRAKSTSSKSSDKEKKIAAEELAREEKYIKLGEKRVELSKKIANAESKKKKTIESVNESLKEQNAALNGNIDALEKFSKVSDVIQGLSGVAFQAALASGAVSSFSSALHDSNAGMGDWIGAFGSALGVVASFIPMITTTTKKFRKLRAAQADQSKANLVGALSWEAYWAAATMGIAAAITIITTLASAIGASNQAMIDKADAAIEAERETQKELKATQKLEKSYLDLYEAYVETGQGKDEMITAADAVIDALESETLQVAKEAEAYGELAQKIREKMLAQQDDIIQSATGEKSAAETKLNAVKSRNVRGFGSTNLGIGRISAGKFANAEEADALDTLDEIFKDSDYYDGKAITTLEFSSLGSMSAEEKVDFYKKLKEATSKDDWDTSANNKINKHVQQILQDEEFSAAYTDYITAVKTQSKEQIRKSILETNYSKSTSFTQFNKQREEWIKELQEAQDIDYDTAAAQVNNLYAEVGGYGATLNERLKWVKGKESALGSKLSVDLLSDALGLASMGAAEYDALKTLNIEKYNSAQDLATAAREKALETQEVYWASLSTERLKSLNSELEKYEKTVEKAYGKEKVQAIEDQNTNLEKQKAILEQVADVAKKTSDEATQNTLDLLSEEGISADSALYQAIQAGNWEEAARIVQSEEESPIADLDVRQQILTSINTSMEAQNKYNEAIADAVEAEEKQLQLRLDHIDAIKEQYDTEIDYLNDINKMMNNQIELMELFGKESKETLKYYDTISKNAAANYKTQYAEFLEFQEKYKNMSEVNTEAMTQEDRLAHETEFNAIKDGYFEAAAAAQESLTEAVNAAMTYYQQEVTVLVDNFTDRLFGDSFKNFQDELNWATGMNDVALDDTNRAYQMQDLRYQYQSIINSTTDLKIRKQLEDIQKREIEYLESRDKLTEKDFERAQQVLEVEKARLALEEARTNKNQMRLTRGADGTYSYEYTADDSAISAAEKALADARNALYNFDKEALQDSLDQYYSAWTETIDKINEYVSDGDFSDLEKKYAAGAIQNALAAGKISAETMKRVTGMTEQELLESDQYGALYRAAIGGSTISETDIMTMLNSIDNKGSGLQDLLSEWGVEGDYLLSSATSDMGTEAEKAANAAATLAKNTGEAVTSAKQLANAYRDAAKAAAIAAYGRSSIPLDELEGRIIKVLPSAYDTGGYTGDWGTTSGKLAVLHEKEIVLNKEDTVNILKAVDLVRALNASMISQVATLGNSSSAVTTNWNTNSNTVAQTVEIKAEFPNATDRSEIEEAFNNLVNLAAQHAFRTTIE